MRWAPRVSCAHPAPLGPPSQQPVPFNETSVSTSAPVWDPPVWSPAGPVSCVPPPRSQPTCMQMCVLAHVCAHVPRAHTCATHVSIYTEHQCMLHATRMYAHACVALTHAHMWMCVHTQPYVCVRTLHMHSHICTHNPGPGPTPVQRPLCSHGHGAFQLFVPRHRRPVFLPSQVTIVEKADSSSVLPSPLSISTKSKMTFLFANLKDRDFLVQRISDFLQKTSSQQPGGSSSGRKASVGDPAPEVRGCLGSWGWASGPGQEPKQPCGACHGLGGGLGGSLLGVRGEPAPAPGVSGVPPHMRCLKSQTSAPGHSPPALLSISHLPPVPGPRRSLSGWTCPRRELALG